MFVFTNQDVTKFTYPKNQWNLPNLLGDICWKVINQLMLITMVTKTEKVTTTKNMSTIEKIDKTLPLLKSMK